MAMIPRPFLLRWDVVEATSDLGRLSLVLTALPDEEFMRFLESRRGHGRNDYPVRAMWNAVVAGIVYRHASMASLLSELRRNRELLQVCGFDPMRGSDAAPSDDAFGRFVDVLVEHRDWIARMGAAVLKRLGELLPDLGKRLAADSKAIASYGSPVRDAKKRARRDGRRDLDADHGVKTYRGIREDGSSWEKVVRWFGYKLHVIVDSQYELPVTWKLTTASRPDVTELVPMVEQLEAAQPVIAARAAELAADKGYDSGTVNETLYEKHGIKPVIDTRALWKAEPTRPVVGDRPDSFVYDERGRVHCVCPVEGKVREMAFAGFEKDRDTLKYRCPAAAYGCDCAGRKECEALADVGDWGRTLRVPLDLDRRIFTPLARSSYAWKTAYARRTAVERFNSRIDRVLGFELHFIRGQAKMQARIDLAFLVYLAMALARVQSDQADLMRSFTAPVRMAA
jgi:hypothetical protein